MEKKRWNNTLGRLVVSENKRHIVFEDGSPFFYLGDTAWELFRRLNREEAQLYLKNRADKGFTLIQTVALGELGGFKAPNPYGEYPLINGDPSNPNPKFFEHIDFIVKCAENLGLFIGFLPTWGAFWKKQDAAECIFTPESAFKYCKFIGERYKNNAVIWILGGDQNIENQEERELIEQMAKGLKAGDGGRNLITFHPRGPGRSSAFLHDAEWLDFNMCQTSHGARDHDNGIFIERDLQLKPQKPALDGEPRYETIPVGFYNENVNYTLRFDDFDVRQAAYWSLFSGAAGHTYGNNNIWQMFAPDREPVISANAYWYDSLDTPGSFQMGFIRKLLESFPFDRLVPAKDLIVDAPAAGGAKVKALISDNKEFALVYSPYGERFTIDKSIFELKQMKEYWFDPRYGVEYFFHASKNAAFQTYDPPDSGRGQDWVLIIRIH